MWANVCGPTYVGLHMWAYICGPTYVGLHMWVYICGPTYVGLHMWAYICGPTYVGLHMWAYVDKGTYVVKFSLITNYLNTVSQPVEVSQSCCGQSASRSQSVMLWSVSESKSVSHVEVNQLVEVSQSCQSFIQSGIQTICRPVGYSFNKSQTDGKCQRVSI